MEYWKIEMIYLRDAEIGVAGLDSGLGWPTATSFILFVVNTGEDLIVCWGDWFIEELLILTGEGAKGCNVGEACGKIVVGETVDKGKLIGGTAPGTWVGGVDRGGDETFAAESKIYECEKYSANN